MLTSTSVFAQTDLGRGLVAYYPFNGNANDESGNGLNGIERNGIQLTTDKYGNANSAYLFDGFDDYIEILDHPKLRLRDSFSVCISYMHLSATSGNLIEKRDFFTGQNTSFDMAAGSLGANGAVKTINDCSNAATGADYTGFTQPPVTNRWYCIVMTFNAGTLNFYQDGVLISSTTTQSPKVDSCEGSNIRIGYHLVFDPIPMHGKIDEVRLYNRAINTDEIAALCNKPPQHSCLWIPNSQSYATIGDLDIPGTSITVEGLFSRDSALTPEGYTSLNVVSKHWTPADVNYLLRVDRAQITTTNGHFMTPAICELENKRLYHAAMTYDGSVLKFYRNGTLMSQIACSGNMIQNNYPTTIGATANSPVTNTQLIGYLNEIRIWNVVKSEAEIRAGMNEALSNPTTIPGLLAYYTFETATNKQGNHAYDVVLHGNASINNSIPDFKPLSNPCMVVLPVNILSFNVGAVNNKSIQVKWLTNDETGITAYQVERSENANGPFENIGNVAAKGQAGQNVYMFTDNTAKPGVTLFYRIKIIERNGENKYTGIRNIILKGNYLLMTLYPNPASSHFRLQLNKNKAAEIFIYNYAGQLVQQESIPALLTNGALDVDITGLSKGIYIIRAIAGTETATGKFEKL